MKPLNRLFAIFCAAVSGMVVISYFMLALQLTGFAIYYGAWLESEHPEYREAWRLWWNGLLERYVRGGA